MTDRAAILAAFDRIERERKHGPEQTGQTISLVCREMRLPREIVSQAVIDRLTGQGAG
jgi:hypothetical protein